MVFMRTLPGCLPTPFCGGTFYRGFPISSG
jgi:hypothetical protein